ncbi:protein-tyrosine-phosphatase [Agromyces sp. MMS17-SY077]|uniref:Protein-tyrosine-phosphatase n=1 Tax=Agromyces seonyuensis TaxID=2662446 RepID=A0A6I4P4K4_9MICO|nr:protein-tyrosine-phosphatase [Agromyces seonyuensis]
MPGTVNFRDPGGYDAEGGRIRAGVLFRSDGLHSLGEDGRAELAGLGVGTVVDLRDGYEVDLMPDDVAGLGLDEVKLPIFEGSGASQQGAGIITLEALYARMVTKHAGLVVEGVRRVADGGGRATLVHCTAGKDRTGVVVAMSLLAVGVPHTLVVEDYAISEENLAGTWLDTMVARIGERGVPDSPALRTLMGGSPPEAIESAIALVEAEHGSVRDWLLAHGLAEAEFARLRDVLVE